MREETARFSRIDHSRVNPGPVRRGADGRALCRECDTPITDQRRTYCTEACKDRAMIRIHPDYARHLVYRRDHGVCSKCGFDAGFMDRIIQHARDFASLWKLRASRYRWWESLRHRLGFNANSAWQAHHVVAVSEGGGCCGLEDYVTLCVPCHRIETRKLRRRRAKA